MAVALQRDLFYGVIEVLLTNKYQRVCPSAPSPFLNEALPQPKLRRLGDHSNLATGWSTFPIEPPSASPDLQPSPRAHPQEVDPFYLFACRLAWEQEEEPSAAWELLAAARSAQADTRAHARALLASSRHLSGLGQAGGSCRITKQKPSSSLEMNMAPYGLDIIDNCSECTHTTPGFFCGFSPAALQSLNDISHKSILPAGAILFVEGQSPRGMFILCSGEVNLSTTSREGKILILKTASAGEALGLSASISGTGYESTAETATPCQVCFLDRNRFLELMQSQCEVGMATAQSLSRDFRSAYRDIHDLVLTRSSAGKLARLLLSHLPVQGVGSAEARTHSAMTHEEMAQRIGASCETVTRLLGNLKKKQLIRSDGPKLVIRDRPALEALAV
jgi:CRP/FNR family transcriptional regulator, cyclic AMP receptor protein